MGGRGNAAGIIAVLQEMIDTPRWAAFFENFEFPYGFHGAEEYERWLKTAGFQSIKARLIPKDMLHAGKAGLAGWIRTTWLPYTQRVPESKQGLFIDELADRYIQKFPPDHEGNINVKMVRLEVEAVKPG
jgi:trans-aconitate methyltransferase